MGFGEHDFWQMGNDQGDWDEESAAEIVPQWVRFGEAREGVAASPGPRSRRAAAELAGILTC